jgi:hypothetical protein
MNSTSRPIGLSSDEVCHEEDFLEWLEPYRHTDRGENPGPDAALSSDFLKGRYSNGLIAFLCAFQGLLPRPAQRPNAILFKVRTFSYLTNGLINIDFYAGPEAFSSSHQIP